MENYKVLAVRYLQRNKKRSIITIFGVVLTVAVLYTILNFTWSFIVSEREAVRQYADYEIVLIPQSEEQAQEILKDSRIKDAYLGSYYMEKEGKVYNNALYINTSFPYQMCYILEQLKASYGIKGSYNDELAELYFQNEAKVNYAVLLSCMVFISFIFAIIAVGIVRNAIQLSSYEQIKDYGNLRCIGASERQLKRMIYLQGAILETIGIVVGTILGAIITYGIAMFLEVLGAEFGSSKVFGFHLLPLLPIAICYYGDLFFAMDENSKMVTKITPVAAIRGEFRIKKEKIRLRKSGIFGKILGVEGDYAYKNIVRNPGKFLKTLGAISFGITALMTISTMSMVLENYMEEQDEVYGHYQLYYDAVGMELAKPEQLRAVLPPQELIEELANLKGISELKKTYHTSIYLGDVAYQNLSDEYKNSDVGKAVIDITEDTKSYLGVLDGYLVDVDLYGYDQEDYERNQKNLVAGTLDISENGIVLVNQEYWYENLDEDNMLTIQELGPPITNFEIGDEIFIEDKVELQKRIRQRIGPWIKKAKKESEDGNINISIESTKLLNEIHRELREEGKGRTYVIEGILKANANQQSRFSFVLPLENYYTLTGTDETMYSGLKFHVDKNKVNLEALSELTSYDYELSLDEDMDEAEDWEEMTEEEQVNDWLHTVYLDSSDYEWVLDGFKNTMYVIYAATAVVMFFMILSFCNIVNSTAASIYMRRREFAQLRVIGISKKRLLRMVLLEGIITAVIADIIGILAGSVLGYICYSQFGTVFKINYEFPFVSMVVSVVVTMLLLCGTIYISIREMGQDLAVDLTTGSE